MPLTTGSRLGAYGIISPDAARHQH